MLGMSPFDSVSRLETWHLKRVGGRFRVPFCDPTEGVVEMPFGDVFLYERWAYQEKRHSGELGDGLCRALGVGGLARDLWRWSGTLE